MTFALGRTLEWYDMPTVRRIVREAAPIRRRRFDLFITPSISPNARSVALVSR